MPQINNNNNVSTQFKNDYLSGNAFSSYQLSGIDAVKIAAHYQKQGITIYLENNLPEIHIIKFIPDDHPSSACKINAMNEMLSIQQALKESERVGYLYRNNSGIGKSHIEAFIIEKEQIIKPALWKAEYFLMLDPRKFNVKSCQTDLDSFCNVFYIPQAGPVECGSLSFAYLKNLLKDNANQLNEFTLHIPFYNSIETKSTNYFFFPSPFILRYSQSERYNKCIEALLQPGKKRNV